MYFWEFPTPSHVIVFLDLHVIVSFWFVHCQAIRSIEATA
jgi:hypothetical protein